MTLYVRTPMSLARRMQQEMNSECENQVGFPIDIMENEEAYVLSALVPGIEAEDLNIEIKQDSISISGEFQHGREEEENYLLVERPSGSFHRKFKFNAPLDAGKAEASLKNGILTLRVPKSEEARPKTIKVSAS